MDAFFAAIEQERYPELAGFPVVIGGSGDPTKRGVVSTASYEARPFGIHSAMPLKKAHQLCPEAIFLPVDYREYKRVSKVVKDILRTFTPTLEDVGIDEAYLDMSEIEYPVQTIAMIRKTIKERTGLTCSFGIAPNKLLAKIASDMDKPDGLTIITTQDIAKILWPLPVRKLIGIGPKTEQHLDKMGIKKIGEIAALPLDVLIKEFGPSYGNYLYHASRGLDERPLVTCREPKSISRERTFQKDVKEWQFIAKTLAGLTKWVVEDMKRSGYGAQTFTLKLRFGDFETYTRSKTIDRATDSEEVIRRTIFGCLKRIKITKRVRLLGVRAGKLMKIVDN
jgi:DNA polymerase-4